MFSDLITTVFCFHLLPFENKCGEKKIKSKNTSSLACGSFGGNVFMSSDVYISTHSYVTASLVLS